MDEWDNDDFATCTVCGAELDYEDCAGCGGEGEIDCYEDDAINYAPGQEYEPCFACGGEGGWWYCPNAERHQAATVAAN